MKRLMLAAAAAWMLACDSAQAGYADDRAVFHPGLGERDLRRK
jgi:hypothetical protein